MAVRCEYSRLSLKAPDNYWTKERSAVKFQNHYLYLFLSHVLEYFEIIKCIEYNFKRYINNKSLDFKFF